jgi:tetratricopeptide (TPR) repeat protein
MAYLHGVELLEAEDYPAAVAELQRALDLRPDFTETSAALAEAHERLGARLEQEGQTASAIEHYRGAIALVPSVETENHLGVLLARSGQIEEAIESFRAALALDPDFPNAKKNLNQALAIQKGERRR